MIVSKQALSYMKIRDVALLFKVSTDPNLFFAKKEGSQDRCSFCIVSSCIFSLSCLAYFTAVKSQRSCMNTSKSKNCQVGTSFVLQSQMSIITMSFNIFVHYFNICFDIGIFWSFLSQICKLWVHYMFDLAPGLSEQVHMCTEWYDSTQKSNSILIIGHY